MNENQFQEFIQDHINEWIGDQSRIHLYLLYSASKGYIKGIQYLIKYYKKNEFIEIFLSACTNNQIQIVKLLIKNVDLTMYKNRILLHTIQNKHLRLLSFLLQNVKIDNTLKNRLIYKLKNF
jgi:hypothetical protein